MNIHLNALDSMDSVLWSNNGGTAQGFIYGPYGSTSSRCGTAGLLAGFNGERLDPVSQAYHLGNGYRTYNPTLMRFNAPDSWSPFGMGGLNPYAYCEGDPINRSDPSGHLSGAAWAGIALGVLGLLGAAFTGGMSIEAAGGVIGAISAASTTELVAGGAGVVADVTAIAAGATSEADPRASEALGWVALGFGLVGGAIGMAQAGRVARAKFRQRTVPVRLLSDREDIEMLPRVAAPSDEVMAGPSGGAADAEPGPSSLLSQDTLLGSPSDARPSDVSGLSHRKPHRVTPAATRNSQEIDGARVTRDVQGPLTFEENIPVEDGRYLFAFSAEDHLYLSRRPVSDLNASGPWPSVNVRSAGQMTIQDGKIVTVSNRNRVYKSEDRPFTAAYVRMGKLGFLDPHIAKVRLPSNL